MLIEDDLCYELQPFNRSDGSYLLRTWVYQGMTPAGSLMLSKLYFDPAYGGWDGWVASEEKYLASPGEEGVGTFHSLEDLLTQPSLLTTDSTSATSSEPASPRVKPEFFPFLDFALGNQVEEVSYRRDQVYYEFLFSLRKGRLIAIVTPLLFTRATTRRCDGAKCKEPRLEFIEYTSRSLIRREFGITYSHAKEAIFPWSEFVGHFTRQVRRVFKM